MWLATADSSEDPEHSTSLSCLQTRAWRGPLPTGVGVRVRVLPRAEAHQPRGPSLLISSPFWLPVPMSPASFLAHTPGP